MAESPRVQEGTAPEGQEAQLEGGNYEVIRARLLEQGKVLTARTEQLNDKRKETFGGTELAVIATERVRTENNCVPRDIASIGDLLLLGYNVKMGLKADTKVGDVFALHKFAPIEGGYDCSAVSLDSAGGFLADPAFEKDLHELYRYYRDASLLQIIETDTRVLAIFQQGASFRDIKVFRWRIEADGRVAYMDARGESDYVFPRAHDFDWKLATRDQQVTVGGVAYLDIGGDVFITTMHGQLALRIEDNTDGGEQIYAEPVEDRNQIMDDAEVHWAKVGVLVLLKVKPFREQRYRYIVFNTRTAKAARIDAIGQACVQLPEDHGIIFPGGYYLQTGDYKLFEGETVDLEFKKALRSPNGEDVLYVFHRRSDGHYVLFSYNLIRKEVQTPIHCHGYCHFDDGRMVVFRVLTDEPTRVHPMQVWSTPFVSAEFAAAAPTDGSFLSKVGNADLVRGVSDALSIGRLIRTDEPNRATFEDIVAGATRVVDSYYWVEHAEAFDLKSVLVEIRGTAELIIDEFEKVVAFKKRAREAIADTEKKLLDLTRDLRPESYRRVEPFLEGMTALRSLRGHIITLRDLRYIDRARLDELEGEVKQHFDHVSEKCVAFLLKEEAMKPLIDELADTLRTLDEVQKAADIIPLQKKVETTAEGLDVLSEVITNLQIDDATARTRILEQMSEVFSQVNRVRATIEGRRRDLASAEGKAEFAAQFKLLGQSVSSSLGLCDTPERCDEQLSRLMVQLEELEGRFSEFDEFLTDLATKREEIYDAFSAKKQTLLDERQRRVQNLASAADRILEGVGRRARSFKSADELNAYFASDAMVMKVRQIAEQLVELGDSVKSDGLESRLKAARQDALRGLRDKLELFEDGDNVIKLGKHRFNVNTQRLELSMVPREGEMTLHMAGTDFYEVIEDEAFQATRALWTQDLISENEHVYRAEYLVASMLFGAQAGSAGLDLDALTRAAVDGDEAKVLEAVRAFAQDRYDEGYDRGLHDADAAKILAAMLKLQKQAGLLRYAPTPRALAILFWAWSPRMGQDTEAHARWHLQARNLGRLRKAFRHSAAVDALATELAGAIDAFVHRTGIALFTSAEAVIAGQYLLEELTADRPRFSTSAEASRLCEDLLRFVDVQGSRVAFDDDLKALDDDLRERFNLARAWLDAFVEADEKRHGLRHLVVEAAVMLCDRGLDREVSAALTEAPVTGLLGQHRRIEGGAMTLRIDEFLSRLGAFHREGVPAYRAYRKLRHELLEQHKHRLRLDELVPKVMTAFVRNKLVNDVYLPLVGDNLAKQIGGVGASKRTDLMGLLLLVSPPGYGKTTLMEYVADRLGLVFVKVNGPALGHSVTSLDPTEAPNATAAQEVNKINLALEMGNNVMLYLDDIQHTHPELLQKFISLCDAQRRIEGVWKGRTRTYDMRGKKFCVVMAGNPYTEAGEKFQIPDMLANRADTYNLGDILEGKDEAFELSYIENALTSNPVLQPLSTREQSDVYKLIRMAKGEPIATTDLSHDYSGIELNEITGVFKHLFRCQDVLLKVNLMYIESAAQDDRFRTEPPFKLQGSYRNMNRLAEKIVPALNDAEVEQLISDHYVGEAQTLTTGAEHNLLKLAAMRGRQTEEQQARWQDICREYVRHKRMGGSADDPVARVTGTLSGLASELEKINDAIVASTDRGIDKKLDGVAEGLTAIRETLASPGPLSGPVATLTSHLSAINAAIAEAASAHVSLASHSAETAQAQLQLATHAGHAAEVQAELVKHAAQGSKAQMVLAKYAAETRKAAADQADATAWMKPMLERIELALAGLASPRLQLDGVDELLKQQVILIERTLVPVVQSATRNMKDGSALAQQLNQVMGLLKQIDERARGGAPGAPHGHHGLPPR